MTADLGRVRVRVRVRIRGRARGRGRARVMAGLELGLLQTLGGLDEAEHARHAGDAEDAQQISGEDRGGEDGVETDRVEHVRQREHDHGEVELVPAAQEVLGAAVADELEGGLQHEDGRAEEVEPGEPHTLRGAHLIG